MEKMSELSISDVKELTQGKKVKVQMASAMSIPLLCKYSTSIFRTKSISSTVSFDNLSNLSLIYWHNSSSIQITEAIVIADPDSGNDGKIAILMPDTGCKIELDSEELIDAIYGNENEITIKFFNNMGSMEIFIIGDIGTETDHVINQDELCQYIKDRLDRY